jgi:hypothetical protein
MLRLARMMRRAKKGKKAKGPKPKGQRVKPWKANPLSHPAVRPKHLLLRCLPKHPGINFSQRISFSLL